MSKMGAMSTDSHRISNNISPSVRHETVGLSKNGSNPKFGGTGSKEHEPQSPTIVPDASLPYLNSS